LTHKAKANDILFRAGQDCAGFVDLISGSIKVKITGENGREIILYRVKPSQICLQTFRCLTKGEFYSAEGIAETDIEFNIIPVAEFQRKIIDDAQFRNRIFGAIAARFSDIEKLVEDVALNSVEHRLAKALLRLMDNEGRVKHTQAMLANEIGTAREVISRHLNRFAKKGLIEISRGEIKIISVNGLKSLA
jgi:CRP/FNR family transcriptional regulator, anaerobic regulatory protein